MLLTLGPTPQTPIESQINRKENQNPVNARSFVCRQKASESEAIQGIAITLGCVGIHFKHKFCSLRPESETQSPLTTFQFCGTSKCALSNVMS